MNLNNYFTLDSTALKFGSQACKFVHQLHSHQLWGKFIAVIISNITYRHLGLSGGLDGFVSTCIWLGEEPWCKASIKRTHQLLPTIPTKNNYVAALNAFIL